jgi:hypothetical protein
MTAFEGFLIYHKRRNRAKWVGVVGGGRFIKGG